MSQYKIDRRLHRQKLIDEAKAMFDSSGAVFTMHNNDLQFNIQTKKGLVVFYPTTGRYMIDGKSQGAAGLEWFFQFVRDKMGFTTPEGSHSENLRAYIIGNLPNKDKQ